MEIKTEKGIAEPMPLSDLQEFTLTQKKRNRIEFMQAIIMFLGLIALIILIVRM